MFERLKNNFQAGISKIVWFSNIFSERAKIEFSIIKLLHRSGEIEKQRNLLMQQIGERVYSLKEHSERNILKDKEVKDTIARIEVLNKDIEEIRERASDMGKVE